MGGREDLGQQTKHAGSQVRCSRKRPFHKHSPRALQRSALTHIANGGELLPQVVSFEAAGGFHRVEAAVINGELGTHEVRPASRTQLSQSEADGWNRPSDIANLASQIMSHYIILIRS